jgi:hypothetical protein
MQSKFPEQDGLPFCGRVLLIDSENRLVPNIPRKEPAWIAALYEQITAHGLPVVNSYGHRYSGPFYKFTNLALTDGRESYRIWTNFNKVNLNIARLFGVRIIISDKEIKNLELVSQFEIVDSNGLSKLLNSYLVDNTNFNGIPISTVKNAGTFSEVIEGLSDQEGSLDSAFDIGDISIHKGKLSVPAEFQIRNNLSEVFVKGFTSGTSTVLLPFEFSNCLRFRQTQGASAALVRLNGIQLALQFSGRLEGMIILNDTGIGLRSCWNQDVLPLHTLR